MEALVWLPPSPAATHIQLADHQEDEDKDKDEEKDEDEDKRKKKA